MMQIAQIATVQKTVAAQGGTAGLRVAQIAIHQTGAFNPYLSDLAIRQRMTIVVTDP